MESINEIIDRCVGVAVAAQERAHPIHSGFKVGAGIYFEGCGVVEGGNLEYPASDTRSLHAEVVALAHGVMMYGHSARARVVAVRTSSSYSVCCGDCLDALSAYASSDMLIVAAPLDLPTAIYTLEEVLPRNYPATKLLSLSSSELELLGHADDASKLGNSKYYAATSGRSGAAVKLANDGIMPGLREGNATLQPVSSIEHALLNARLAGEEISMLAYISDSGFLCGRDRQRVMEFASSQKNFDFPVLMQSRLSGEVQVTSVENLLPQAFLPTSL